MVLGFFFPGEDGKRFVRLPCKTDAFPDLSPKWLGRKICARAPFPLSPSSIRSFRHLTAPAHGSACTVHKEGKSFSLSTQTPADNDIDLVYPIVIPTKVGFFPRLMCYDNGSSITSKVQLPHRCVSVVQTIVGTSSPSGSGSGNPGSCNGGRKPLKVICLPAVWEQINLS